MITWIGSRRALIGGAAAAAFSSTSLDSPAERVSVQPDVADLRRRLAQAGAIVRLPPGEIDFTTLTSPFRVAAGVRMIGSDSGTTIRTGKSCIGLAVLDHGASVEHLTVVGVGARQLHDANVISGIPRIRDAAVRDVHIRHWRGNGVLFEASLRCRITDVTGSDIHRTSEYRQGSLVLLTSDAGDSVGGHVLRVVAKRCAGSGLQFEGDFRRKDWRTSGHKVRQLGIDQCEAYECAYAGIFLNSGFDCVIQRSIAARNADYGIGMEFCRRSKIEQCATSQNLTFGQAMFESNDSCVIQNGTATHNRLDGFIDMQGTSVDSLPANDNSILDVTATRNHANGIAVVGTQRTHVRGLSTHNRKAGVLVLGATGVVVRGRTSHNHNDGVELRYSSRAAVAVTATANLRSGITVIGSGGHPVQHFKLHVDAQNNGLDGVRLSGSDVSDVVVRGKLNRNSGWGLASRGAGTRSVDVASEFVDNVLGGVSMPQPHALRIVGSSFRGRVSTRRSAPVAVDLPASNGFSGGDVLIARNRFESFATGIRASAGSNIGVGHDVVLAKNVFVSVNSPYQLVNSARRSAFIVR